MIDERASIHPSARIADNVSIGPYTIIGEHVEIDEGTWIGPHVVINGPTRIGKNNQIFQFSSFEMCQDKKYQGEDTLLEIGDNNVIREFCTLNRGTVQDRGATSIGNNNLLMAYVHIAHDCVIGNNTVFANNATLAGHVIVEDYAQLGGFTGVHQFCRIGAYSFSAMGSMIVKDVLPYVKVSGYYAKPFGLNSVGLQRNDFSPETIANLRRAYRIIYRQGYLLEQAIEELQGLAKDCPEVQPMIDNMRQSSRGITR